LDGAIRVIYFPSSLIARLVLQGAAKVTGKAQRSKREKTYLIASTFAPELPYSRPSIQTDRGTNFLSKKVGFSGAA